MGGYEYEIKKTEVVIKTYNIAIKPPFDGNCAS